MSEQNFEQNLAIFTSGIYPSLVKASYGLGKIHKGHLYEEKLDAS